ncbi:hypothetical protein HPP92_026547 [Vanilla planifolia]|uniref:Late embryogenesis abundant protein LEA-2 subgroup domain-containing protein n=1 Tax=Vanilla planifolia TaxID=51239 RepID=A0A835PF50_VANPL|nr:hypothetical protein HPP92_026775 [Vanilla planifolia]KAG0450824.1 hypothetical protein HPP92_026547 [Vanilla planifolia]
MADSTKPVLQRPPGYRNPSAPADTVKLPAKKPQLPPTLRHPGKPSRRYRRNGRSCCCCLCCCLFVLILVMAILIAAAAGVGYVFFQPRLPTFRVENVTVSVFKLMEESDGTFLDASVTVKMQASNPNEKLGLSYHDVRAKVDVADEDGDVEVGTGSAVDFRLGKRNSTLVMFVAVAKGVMVDDAAGTRLKTRYQSKEIRFAVEMRASVGFVFGGKSMPKLPIRVKCANVILKQTGGGRSSPKCDIDFIFWNFLS